MPDGHSPMIFNAAWPFDLTLNSVLIFILFIWSGFVRTGLGFGGALLTMPFILLIDNRPLIYLPVIALHLLIFSPLTLWQSRRQQPDAKHFFAQVDWAILKRTLPIMLPAKLLGVIGIINLPSHIITPIIYGVVAIYALSYLLNKPIVSSKAWMDWPLLSLGAYFSGTSLVGGPLIMAVYIGKVAKDNLRDTIFVLWFILVAIKMFSFVALGVDLQLAAHLWALPAAFIGHVLGEYFHRFLIQREQKQFFQIVGGFLLVACTGGLIKQALNL
ncbi:MAG TPA: sulfite exporter TauE/SafE family protein [Cellvibrionaceae bacterium]|nr:sulfite exporter TauE/SafE family protein [Cellvibrionaceae bacterium]HMW71387.1 sulfite exporter TauE/SafE family protein [Cellvibrionaceae bacterium]HMY40914.1 sulfite exporter TauE/SafE family protein [Marinagarivorans sp.]HNG60352.1 sulfite exporter TauE/SafE family protein [Cellvibrionaceae bacterium]